ncbi:MAG: invasion associated locus B family protein [Vicinamibacterales bacterium]
MSQLGICAVLLLGLPPAAVSAPVGPGDAPRSRNAAQGAPAAAVSPLTLPGGATAIEETHGDWRVICVPRPDGTHCVVSQQLMDPNTRQRVVAVELAPADGDGLTGTMALPFGLRLATGVTVQIDGTAEGQAHAFHTCVPAGCLVPLTLDASATARLREGAAITLGASAAEGAQPVQFRVSLTGFASALARARALGEK